MPPCLTKSDRGPRNSLWLRVRILTPAVNLSFEHPAGDSTILLGLPPLFPFHLPHERTCDSMAIEYPPMPQKHYTFTNIHLPTAPQSASLNTQLTKYQTKRNALYRNVQEFSCTAN
ncbi:hypothetical protein TNCV_1249111 [Trichonephila clavipes]|nr:hypothetical protein TNCV_1249111 [Trichonephila clavipes]